MIEDKTREVRDLERKIERLKRELDSKISFKEFDEELTKDRIKILKSCETDGDSNLSNFMSQRLEQRKQDADSEIEDIKREIEETEKALEIAKEKQKMILERQRLIEKVTKMDIYKISDVLY